MNLTTGRASAWTPPPEQWGFRDIAPHIRGRVFVRHRPSLQPIVCFEVINTRTGRVLASDNVALHTRYGSGLPKIVRACHEAVAAARGAWTYDLRRSALS